MQLILTPKILHDTGSALTSAFWYVEESILWVLPKYIISK